MKTIFLSFFLILTFICKGQTSKDDPVKDFCTGPGSGNVIIDPLKGQRMIDSFERYYLKDTRTRNGIQRQFWVSRNDIIELNKFLNQSNKDYDGVRIIFGADNTTSRKTDMYIVPTMVVKNDDGTINNKMHDEDWGILKLPSKKYTPLKADVSKHRDRFVESYVNGHTQSDLRNMDTVSKKAWIAKCVIQSIADLMKPGSGVTGLNVNMAAYYEDSIDDSIGQIRAHQSTIVLVTTKASRANDWELTQKLYNYFFKTAVPATGTTKLAAFNHSQLCPQICYP